MPNGYGGSGRIHGRDRAAAPPSKSKRGPKLKRKAKKLSKRALKKKK
jgi:hypothetical protein